MSRLFGIMTVLLVLFLAMAFAAANAGHRVTLSLGIFTLYQVPVTLVAFSGLFVGMLVMFATGIHSDLKVRRILRERLAEESRQEQVWIDRNQQDLFLESARLGSDAGKAGPWEASLATAETLPNPEEDGTADGPAPDGAIPEESVPGESPPERTSPWNSLG